MVLKKMFFLRGSGGLSPLPLLSLSGLTTKKNVYSLCLNNNINYFLRVRHRGETGPGPRVGYTPASKEYDNTTLYTE